MYKLCYFEMRWYPWGIQRLVSTHSFPPCSRGGGEGCTLDQFKSKVTSTGQMFMGGGIWTNSIQSPNPWPNFHVCVYGGEGVGGVGERGDSGPTQPKSQVLTKFSFLGRGILWTPHSSNTWVGHTRNFKHTILIAQARSCITDSLSHTTCVQTNENQT